MSELIATIRAAHAALTEVANTQAQVGVSGTLAQASSSFFLQLPSLSSHLLDVCTLVEARETAFEALSLLPNQQDPGNPELFMFGTLKVPFWQARFLLLQAYLATSWAVYDATSKVAGNICCTDDRAKDLSKPVKLQEDLVGDKARCVGARMHEHLRLNYGWPIGVSYALRNWIVHDGVSQASVELFQYRNADVAPFALSDGGWDSLKERCGIRYKLDETYTRLRPFPDITRDVVSGLKACHKEVDEAVGFLLLWGAQSVQAQARILFARDLPQA